MEAATGASASASSVTKESARILRECLITNIDLNVPASVQAQLPLVHFTPESAPYIPTPMKITESCSALWACVGMFASAISQERYKTPKPKKISVDVHAASLMLFSLVLFRLGGKGLTDPEVLARAAFLDKGKISEIYRGLATNIYRTKDDKFFHLHGSLNTTPTLDMLGLPQHRPDLSTPEHRDAIKAIYQKVVAQHDGLPLELEANERWRTPGVLCLTMDEYANTVHGKMSIKEPLYYIHNIKDSSPPAQWPAHRENNRPLAGIRVLDLTKVVAGPTITRILALLGADVLRISTSDKPDASILLYDGQLGKRDTEVNLKSADGKKAFEKLLQDADVLVDGFRPGCLDRLGFGRTWCQEVARRRGKGLIYARENCYGWNGEWSHRAGYQQISDCVSGASWEQGRFLGLNEPVVPLLPNSDYQTGIVGAIAICNALLQRSAKGGSYNVDVSLTQFNNWYLRSIGLHDQETQAYLRNLHPDFKPAHDTELFELIKQTMQTTMVSNGNGKGDLWDPARYTVGPARWGTSGETAEYVDWGKIVTIDSAKDSFGFENGSCMPGSDEPVWL